MNRLKLIYGENEIKTIQPIVKRILADIDKHSLPLHKLGASKTFSEEITTNYNVLSAHSTGTAFITPKQVIKIGYLTRNPPSIKHRVPTLIYSTDDIDWKWDAPFVVMIQPRVKMLDIDDAVQLKKANTHFKNLFKTTDASYDNIGIYRRQFKLIDW